MFKTKDSESDSSKENPRIFEDDWKFIRTDIKLVTNDTFERIKKLVNNEYMSDPNCVYKICKSLFNKYLVVLQKQEGVLTNESRHDIFDPNYAKFRSNGLLVKQIIQLKHINPNVSCITHKTICIDGHTNYKKYTKYQVNCFVVPDTYC